MPNIGPVELIVILVIALIVIGPGRLPDVGAALGKSIREFRKASSDISDATNVDTSPQPAATPPAAAAAPVAAPPPAPVAPNTLAAETPPNTLADAPPPAPSAAPAPTPELVQPAPATPTSPSPVPVPHVDDDAGRPA
jgi:sec-independent protein translocase protein TatA